MALQATADFYQLERLIADLAVEAGDSPTGEAIDLDPARIWFMGHSQGASAGLLSLSQSLVTRGGVIGGLMDAPAYLTAPLGRGHLEVEAAGIEVERLHGEVVGTPHKVGAIDDNGDGLARGQAQLENLAAPAGKILFLTAAVAFQATQGI